ncbi:MAG: hypothetical protein ABI823_12255, partial [Bryobacteraceae bacterium]
ATKGSFALSEAVKGMIQAHPNPLRQLDLRKTASTIHETMLRVKKNENKKLLVSETICRLKPPTPQRLLVYLQPHAIGKWHA